MRFWFHVYSPHRTRWTGYAEEEKRALLREHASMVFEDCCRRLHPEAARYWEGNLEFDFVRGSKTGTVVTEVKFKSLSKRERRQVHERLSREWKRCRLAAKHPETAFEVMDTEALELI